MNFNLTLLGQSLAFILFVWFCMRYVWPPVIQTLRERQSQIAAGLEAAERGKRELEQAHARAEEELQQARQQAAEIVERANRRAEKIVEEARVRGQEEGQRQKAAATAEIEQERNRAREELRSRLGTLAVQGAEKILRRSVDANAHREVVEQLVTEL